MSSRIVDNLIAYRVLYMLVTPFTDTKAYKLGIIDKDGKNLRKSSSLKTSEEKDAYTYLNRLVFNLKKIINKLPGGDTRIKNLIAALWLVKEYYESNDRATSLMEERFNRILESVNQGIVLVEEELMVNSFLKSFSEEVPVNNTAGASVSEPKIDPKKIKKFREIVRRPEVK